MGDRLVTNLSKYARLRDPLDCIDIRVYDGSKLYAQRAVIAELDEEFEAESFVRQICTGESPAQMTLYNLLMEQYPWACSEGSQVQVAIWTTTEEGCGPDALLHVEYCPTLKNFRVLHTYVAED